jgi:hypothetical protein
MKLYLKMLWHNVFCGFTVALSLSLVLGIVFFILATLKIDNPSLTRFPALLFLFLIIFSSFTGFVIGISELILRVNQKIPASNLLFCAGTGSLVGGIFCLKFELFDCPGFALLVGGIINGVLIGLVRKT